MGRCLGATAAGRRMLKAELDRFFRQGLWPAFGGVIAFRALGGEDFGFAVGPSVGDSGDPDRAGGFQVTLAPPLGKRS